MDLDAIDRLVAEKVMGWRFDEEAQAYYGADGLPLMWAWHPGSLSLLRLEGYRPTRDAGQAMELFEQLPGVWSLSHEVDDTWLVSNDQECKSMPIEDLVLESATTFKLAICRAALKKAGVEVPQ